MSVGADAVVDECVVDASVVDDSVTRRSFGTTALAAVVLKSTSARKKVMTCMFEYLEFFVVAFCVLFNTRKAVSQFVI